MKTLIAISLVVLCANCLQAKDISGATVTFTIPDHTSLKYSKLSLDKYSVVWDKASIKTRLTIHPFPDAQQSKAQEELLNSLTSVLNHGYLRSLPAGYKVSKATKKVCKFKFIKGYELIQTVTTDKGGEWVHSAFLLKVGGEYWLAEFIGSKESHTEALNILENAKNKS